MGSAAVGLIAGTLTTLSPCVLPALPLVVGSAAGKHKLGPLAVAVGMVLSFTVTGVLLATVGFSLGIDEGTFRTAAAVLFIVFGVILLSAKLQSGFARIFAPLSRRSDKLLSHVDGKGLLGQLVVGLLLGVVWSPCSGPTLGIAVSLAAQEGTRLAAMKIFFLFGLGASVPLLALAYGSRKLFMEKRGLLGAVGTHGRVFFGGAMLFVGVAVITGADRYLEMFFLDYSPQWLVSLATAF